MLRNFLSKFFYRVIPIRDLLESEIFLRSNEWRYMSKLR